jgi:hypothetical protein
MLGPFEYGIWIAGFILEVTVVVCALLRSSFLKYLTLNIYMLALATSNILSFYFVFRFGYSSLEYRYFFYYSEFLLTVLFYVLIISFFRRVLGELDAHRYVTRAATWLLLATAAFSYLVVQKNVDHMTSRFVVEMSQNLYFVGVVLTYLLWVSLLKVRVTNARLVHLVLSLGVFLSVHAAFYGLRNLAPDFAAKVLWLPPLFGVLLPLAWAFTFLKIPEEARLAPSRVAAAHR